MNRRLAVLALAIGLVGFAAIETAGRLTGTLTAMTDSLALDAIAYALGTVILTLVLAPLLRRARGVAVAGVVLLFLLLYAPLVAVIAGAFELTASGTWGVPGLVRSAFIAGPVNLVYTFVLDLPFVAVPLGVLSVLVLWRAARSAVASRRPLGRVGRRDRGMR
jgi:hypothetical protein